MANVPLKWGKVEENGKVEINGADNVTFTSASPSLKTNGDMRVTGKLTVNGEDGIQAAKLNGSTIGNSPLFTDKNVRQVGTNTNKDFEVLFSESDDNVEHIEEVRKNANLLFNPYTGTLTTSKVTTQKISVSTPSYTLAADPGTAWNVGSVSARRCGNIINMSITLTGTGTGVAGGTDGFSGKLSGGPLPALPITLVSYVQNFVICCYIDTSGNVEVRPIGSGTYTAAQGASIEMEGTFICE